MEARKAEFLTELVCEELLDNKLVRFHAPFRYYSAILGREIEIPTGFVCDLESVPLIKASSKRAGGIHDYLCRKNSDPIVSKAIAAAVYKEAQECKDNIICKGKFDKLDNWIRRNIKTLVVRIAFGYYHKYDVFASAEELKNL
jgi:hypothetical protein